MKPKDAVSRIEEKEFYRGWEPLKLFTDWVALRRFVMNAPEYELGDKVEFEVKGEIEGVSVTSKGVGWITAMRLAIDSISRYVEYGISEDQPTPFYPGKPARWWRHGACISQAARRQL